VNWLDILLLLVIGVSVILGFMRGFARVGIGFLATVAGLLLAFGFYRTAGDWVSGWVDSGNIANLLGFALIFLGVVVAGSLTGWLFSKLLRKVGLGWLDRLAGAGLGGIRGVFLGVVLLLAMVAFAPSSPPGAVRDSQLAPYVVEASNVMIKAAPRELKDTFARGYEKLKSSWSELHRHAKPSPSGRA
jgi:membrane protein required for colicin V production